MPEADPSPEDREARRLERKARRQDAQRASIVAAARGVLLDKGISGFSVAAVARAAGISKPRVYYYIENKDALAWLVILELVGEEVDAMLDAIDAAPTGIEALVAMMRSRAAYYRADMDIYRALWVLPHALTLPDGALDETYALSREVNVAVEEKLAVDKAAGRLHHAVAPRELTNVAYATVHGLLGLYASVEALGGNMHFPFDRLLDEAVATVVRGIEPEGWIISRS